VRFRALAVAFLFASASAVPAQPPEVADPDVRKGITLVDDGEYDAAILALDGAARRLAADEKHSSRDLAEAYFYLGVAYLGKGHETSARARFREAVRQMRDMSPSPEKFPPRVIELFEKAREESKADAPAAAAAPAPAATSAAAPAKEKGGSKTLLIVGGLALAGGGAALALGGGDDDPGVEGLPPNAQVTRTESGAVGAQEQAGFTFVATRAGTMEATVNWQDRNVTLQIDCQEEAPPYTGCGGAFNRTSDTSGRYTASVTQKAYLVLVSNFSARAGAEPFTIVLRYP
jgi:hypothetical protein